MVPPLRYYPAYELIKRAAEEHAGPVLGPCRVPFHSIPFHSIPFHCIAYTADERVGGPVSCRTDDAVLIMRCGRRRGARRRARAGPRSSDRRRGDTAKRGARLRNRLAPQRLGEECRQRCVDGGGVTAESTSHRRAARRSMIYARLAVTAVTLSPYIYIYICIYITLRVARHAPCSIGNGGVLVMR